MGRVQWARAICVIFTDAFPKTVGAAVVSVAGKSDARATKHLGALEHAAAKLKHPTVSLRCHCRLL